MVDGPALHGPVVVAVDGQLPLGLVALQLLLLHVQLPQLALRPGPQVRHQALERVHPLHAQVDGAQLLCLIM